MLQVPRIAWHRLQMRQGHYLEQPDKAPVQRALVENLYVEAMVLADEAYTAFAAQRGLGSGDIDSLTQVGLACESLKTTTRMMHIIAWLLHHRAMMIGEPGAGPRDSAARLGDRIAADWAICDHFDAHCRQIVSASERLFDRVAALEASWHVAVAPVPTPVHQLLARLEARL